MEDLVKKFLAEKQVMQLATVSNGQPWLCNVHFVPDKEQTLYWISKPSRRHSQEIEKDSKAAIAIAVRYPKHPVIGIQMEGSAYKVDNPSEIKTAMVLYDERYNLSSKFHGAVVAGTANEKVYKFTPKTIVLFDEEHFPDNSRQEWKNR